MRTVFTYLLLVCIGVLIGFAVPRSVVEEARLVVRWQYRPMVTAIPDTVLATASPLPTQSGSDQPTGSITAILDDSFLSLDVESGRLLRSEVRADTFSVSSDWYINQNDRGTRWRVQSWANSSSQFVVSLGQPSFAGSFLYQVDSNGTFNISDLSRPAASPMTIGGLDNLVSYHLCGRCSPPRLVRGNWLGLLDVTFLDAQQRFDYVFETEPFSTQVPVIYGVRGLKDGRVGAVVGQDPQQVVVLSLEDGSFNERSRFEVADGESVRHPIAIVGIRDGGIAFPFRSSLLLLDDQGESGRWIDTPGIRDVIGGFRRGEYTVLGMSTTDGSSVLIVDDEGLLRWSWRGASIAGFYEPDGRAGGELFLMEVDGLLVAVEVVL